MRSVAVIYGSIKGMGLTRRCEMLAMREERSENGPVVFSRCCIIDESPDFPDGDYLASFTGHTVSMRREGGLWLPSGDAVPVGGEKRRAHPEFGKDRGSAAPFLAVMRKYSI